MNLFIVFETDHLDSHLSGAFESNNRAGLATFAQDIRKASTILKSWAQTSGGSSIVDQLPLIAIEIPAEKTSSLPDMRRQFEAVCRCTVSVGVGMELSEAYKALQVAKSRGGDQIALYVPEMEEELQHHDTIEKAEKTPAERESGAIRHRRTMKHARRPHDFEPAKWTHPNGHPRCHYCGDEERIDGKCPGADHDGLDKAEGDQPQQAGAQPEQPQQEEPTKDPKEAIAQALKNIKTQAPVIEQLKATNPDAFAAVMDAINAMIILAQGMTQDEGTKKGEEDPAGEDHRLDSDEGLDKSGLPMPEKTSKRPHEEPVGLVRDGKVKIEHKDIKSGATTGTGWVQVRSGMVRGKEGHAVSSTKQNSD
jgi:hypothetical protein